MDTSHNNLQPVLSPNDLETLLVQSSPDTLGAAPICVWSSSQSQSFPYLHVKWYQRSWHPSNVLMAKVHHLPNLQAAVLREALGALPDRSGLGPASPPERDASRSSQTLLFVKIGGLSPKADTAGAGSLCSLRLSSLLVERNTKAFNMNIFTDLEGNF